MKLGAPPGEKGFWQPNGRPILAEPETDPAIADGQGRILYTTLDLVREHGILAPVFHRHVGHHTLALLEGLCSSSLDVQTGFQTQVPLNQEIAFVTDPPIKAGRTILAPSEAEKTMEVQHGNYQAPRRSSDTTLLLDRTNRKG